METVVNDALPDSQIGHRAISLAGMMHYLQGTTLSQILDVYNYHLHFQMTEDGLMQAWHRVGEILRPWYNAILEEIQNQAVLNADETGWRVLGKTYWLWCLATKNAAYYLIDPKHGGSVLETVVPFIFQRCVGDRFLGCLQLGFLPCEAEVPATPVEGSEPNPALPQPRGRLARVSLKITPTDHRRKAVEESRKGHSVGIKTNCSYSLITKSAA